MAFRPIEHSSDNFFIPEKIGDSVEGILSAGGDMQTSFGLASYVFVGDKKVLLSGALANTITPDFYGLPIRVTFKGMQYNQKSKRNFKDFLVEVDDGTNE